MTALVLICMMIPIGIAAAEKTGTVFGGWLILRSTPSFSGAIKSSYPTGTKVTITGQNGSWYAVKAPDGLTGYMLGNYLRVSGSSTPSGSTAWVTSANGLNVRLRTGPGTGYSILASYAPGTKCTILSAGNNPGSRRLYRMGNQPERERCESALRPLQKLFFHWILRGWNSSDDDFCRDAVELYSGGEPDRIYDVSVPDVRSTGSCTGSGTADPFSLRVCDQRKREKCQSENRPQQRISGDQVLCCRYASHDCDQRS